MARQRDRTIRAFQARSGCVGTAAAFPGQLLEDLRRCDGVGRGGHELLKP